MAMPTLPLTRPLPLRFSLEIPGDGLSLYCRAAWRRDHKIGVAFIKKDDGIVIPA